MFFPFLGVIAAATTLVQLGALAVTVQILKAMLSVAIAVALLLGLAWVWRSNKGSGIYKGSGL